MGVAIAVNEGGKGAVILDTNVFVAAGFNTSSASAKIVARVRTGELRLVWNEQTRRETISVLRRIPPLRGIDAGDLFREEGRFDGETRPEAFAYIPDAGDRKFAALAAASGADLISNDGHLLNSRGESGLRVFTPREFAAQSLETQS